MSDISLKSPANGTKEKQLPSSIESIKDGKQTLPTVILASTSPYRAGLLDQIQISYQQAAPGFAEFHPANADPAELALKFAEEKAKSLQARFTSHIIIGSDQTACLDQQILTKPGTMTKAVEQLCKCSGKTVIFHTALAVLNTRTNHLQSTCDKVEVTFRQLSVEEAQRYVESELPLDCCGSFKVEGPGISLFKSVKSTDPYSLIGLPLIALTTMLRNEGFQIP